MYYLQSVMQKYSVKFVESDLNLEMSRRKRRSCIKEHQHFDYSLPCRYIVDYWSFSHRARYSLHDTSIL